MAGEGSAAYNKQEALRGGYYSPGGEPATYNQTYDAVVNAAPDLSVLSSLVDDGHLTQDDFLKISANLSERQYGINNELPANAQIINYPATNRDSYPGAKPQPGGFQYVTPGKAKGMEANRPGERDATTAAPSELAKRGAPPKTYEPWQTSKDGHVAVPQVQKVPKVGE